MTRFKNKYRSETVRLPYWDYGWDSAYFVTICTKNKEYLFGEIKNQEMICSDLGIIAKKYWEEIPNRFPFVLLDVFVIMPNHIHGIIVIDKEGVGYNVVQTAGGTQLVVETQLIASLPSTTQKMPNQTQPGGFAGNKNPLLNNNLSRIVRWFKGRTTFEARKNNPLFAWQPNYYEHIIRNKKSFANIQHYIINNPIHWNNDKLYTQPK